MTASQHDVSGGPERRPEVAVGAVVVHDGLLLLIRRGRGPGAGQWSLPGGRVRFGESLTAALQREMREETGLSVEVGPLCGIAERRSEEAHFVIIDFWCEVTGDPVPTAGDDAAEVLWVRRSDLHDLDLVPSLLEFLAEHGVLEHLE